MTELEKAVRLLDRIAEQNEFGGYDPISHNAALLGAVQRFLKKHRDKT